MFDSILNTFLSESLNITAWKVSKYGIFLVHIFPLLDWYYRSVFSQNAGKYGPEKTPYLDTFHAVDFNETLNKLPNYDHKVLMKLKRNYRTKIIYFLNQSIQKMFAELWHS